MDLIPAGRAEYQQQLRQLMPPGPAWPAEDRIIDGTAGALALLHADAMRVVEESDPSSTSWLLPRWEAVFGLPDGCRPSDASPAARRSILAAREVADGDQTPDFFVRQAKLLGYPNARYMAATALTAGDTYVSDVLMTDAAAANTWWIVPGDGEYSLTQAHYWARAGSASCSDTLYAYQDEVGGVKSLYLGAASSGENLTDHGRHDIECMLDRLIQAHTWAGVMIPAKTSPLPTLSKTETYADLPVITAGGDLYYQTADWS